MTDAQSFWTDQQLSWAAVGFLAYCQHLDIKTIEYSNLPTFIRGAYVFHPDDQGDLDEAVDTLLATGYLDYVGDTVIVHWDS